MIPTFVLRASNVLAPSAIRAYGRLCADRGWLEEAHDASLLADRFAAWQATNGGQLGLGERAGIRFIRGEVDDLADIRDVLASELAATRTAYQRDFGDCRESLIAAQHEIASLRDQLAAALAQLHQAAPTTHATPAPTPLPPFP